MPIANLAAYRAAIDNPHQIGTINMPSLNVLAGRTYDTWASAAPVGVVPTTAAVPTSLTAGSMGQINPAGVLGVAAARINTLNPGVYLVCDRLSHQGGLSGIVTGVVTTNLPTAALTRYTTGEGVMLALSIYSQIGATATTVTATYTNSAGVGSRVTPLQIFGGTAYREGTRFIQLPLQVGDTGVRSVQSVTVAATTGTAGAYGVTLYKPLVAVISDKVNGVAICDLVTGNMGGGLAPIVNDACLFTVVNSSSVSAAGAAALYLTEW